MYEDNLTCFRSLPGKSPDSGIELLPEDRAGEQEEEKDTVRCAFCQHEVTGLEECISVNGSHAHVFANPHGFVFEIGCFKKAIGCRVSMESSCEFSWFAGYRWKIAVCGACFNHLGWFFASESNTFFGLIFKNLIIPQR